MEEKYNYIVHLVTYANGSKYGKDYEKSQRKITRTYYKYNMSSISNWNRNLIMNSEFYKNNKEILDEKKGDGLWLWKPYIIYERLKEIKENEYVYYQDCYADYRGFRFSVLPVIKFMENNNLEILPGFKEECCNYGFIKDEMKKYFDLKPEYLNRNQICASPLFIKKTENSMKIIKEWLDICCDKEIMMKYPNVARKQHNYDMSVLNMIMCKYNIKTIDINLPKQETKNFNKFLEIFNSNQHINLY
jgi:hypothetical protein